MCIRDSREIVDREGLAVKPGAKELIMLGKEKGYRLAVATSSRRDYASRLLKEAKVYDYFDGFVFGDMVSHSKPNPEIYEKACEAIGVLPQQSVAFEDAPAGIRSAAAAGLRVVAVPDLVQPPKELEEKICIRDRDVRGKEQYKKEILAIYDRALESEEEEIRQGAIIALYNECLRTEQYELAQSYLDRIPKKWINLDSLQAMLYRKAGKRQEAYELLERILFQSCLLYTSTLCNT